MAASSNRFERQRQWTVVAVIGLGFFVTYWEALSQAVFPYSPLEVLITVGVGGVYLILSLKEDQLLDRHPLQEQRPSTSSSNLASLAH